MNFIPAEQMERIALNDFASYKDKKGLLQVSFPLDAEDIFHVLFGLSTSYIDFDEHGIKWKTGARLLGALYPDGFFFSGEDRQILVNAGYHNSEDAELFPFVGQMQRFTVYLEGGHYAIHVRPGKSQTSLFPRGRDYYRDEPFLCRGDQIVGKIYDPVEYQANRYAGAMMMPSEEVYDLVGRTKSVDLRIHGSRFRQHFGVSQKAMEKRLLDLGYHYINGKYDELFKGREVHR